MIILVCDNPILRQYAELARLKEAEQALEEFRSLVEEIQNKYADLMGEIESLPDEEDKKKSERFYKTVNRYGRKNKR